VLCVVSDLEANTVIESMSRRKEVDRI